MCNYVHVNGGVPQSRDVRSPWSQITDSSEPLDVGAGNRTLDLSKHTCVFITTSPAPDAVFSIKRAR